MKCNIDKKILIVDEDSGTIKSIKDIVSRQENATIFSAISTKQVWT